MSSREERKSFRKSVANTLKRRFFYKPSFKHNVSWAGFYDLWRQHFVNEENMLELQCATLIPEVVLQASGHVDKFTDFMVKDEKNSQYYRAVHLLKQFCTDKLEKDLNLTEEKKAEFKHVLATLDDLSREELGRRIKEYDVTAPDTNNPLSDRFLFNLTFPTSIGPSGSSRGYLRPEATQSILYNFNELYSYNGSSKLLFAAAQIGQVFRNEMSPRQGLLNPCESTLAEIQHFMDPEDESHRKFNEVLNLEVLLFQRADQVSG